MLVEFKVDKTVPITVDALINHFPLKLVNATEEEAEDYYADRRVVKQRNVIHSVSEALITGKHAREEEEEEEEDDNERPVKRTKITTRESVSDKSDDSDDDSDDDTDDE